MKNPDRVVPVLTALTSFAYQFMRAGGVLVLVALPLIKVFGQPGAFHYSLELPVAARTVSASVETAWGPAPLLVDDVRGTLKVPITTAPWPVVVLLWSYAAIAFALMLRFLGKLKRFLQSVRDGRAFDAENAVRLRTLGVLLLAIAGLRTVAELLTSFAVRRGLPSGSDVTVPNGMHMDGTLVVIALVLMALAEVFRRGAELESEQSLVV